MAADITAMIETDEMRVILARRRAMRSAVELR
jgi:hypothetical protein